jgi:hypothetical protein
VKAAPVWFTEKFARVLQCFDARRAALLLDARSFDGIGQQQELLTLPCPDGVPRHVLGLVRDGWTLRILPAAVANLSQQIDLPAAIVVWRPRTAFKNRTHVVTDEGQATIAAAIATMPPPSIVVDAGPEVWGAWRLDQPITDLARAHRLLSTLADRLGGDTSILANLATFSVPICGPIRSWNSERREHIRIELAHPNQVYALATFEQPIKEKTDVSSGTAGSRVSHGSRARRHSTAVGA